MYGIVSDNKGLQDCQHLQLHASLVLRENKVSFPALLLLISMGFKEGSYFLYEFNPFRLLKRKSQDDQLKCSEPLSCLLGKPKEGSENYVIDCV